MQEFKIFLGSSFKLMGVRKNIGDIIRELNDNWLKKGIRLKLFIWEDYIIGYSGKHKQQEYIDNMVLPSDFCIFMFSERVGMYTKQELEAKLMQDRNSVVCYRLPAKGMFKESVKNELKSLGTTFIDVKTNEVLCEEVKRLIEERLRKMPNTTPGQMNELFFYTTIPDDLSKERSSIGTALRNFDDATMDEWGIHCVLHPMYQINLLDHTDHYIPILLKKVSENDIIELKAGLERAKDSRIKRITVFDRGNIYKDNDQVRNLLDEPGVFTDKIADLEGLKWKLHEWLRKTKNTLFSYENLSVKNNSVTINNIPVASVSSIGDSGSVKDLAKQIELHEQKAQQIIDADSENDEKINNMVDDLNYRKRYLGIELAHVMNRWTDELISSGTEFYNTIRQCIEIESEVGKIFCGSISEKESSQLKDLLITKEKLETELAEKGVCQPLKLLNTQLILVGVYDLFFSHQSWYRNEEDSLFARIIENVDKAYLIDANAELVRVNIGNMYNRNGNFEEADRCYRKAILNLKSLDDNSVRVKRCITLIYNQLFHLEIETGYMDSYATLMEFKEHVSMLDELNDLFFVDRCMYTTAELTQIDIEDNSLYGIVETAKVLYEEAKNNHFINDIKSDAFFGVMVYMPHMIARYYIDHFPVSGVEQMNDFFKQADFFLNEAYDNCERLKIKDYKFAMFELGEIQHNRGFLYSNKIDKWGDSKDAYSKAYDWKLRYFNLTKEPSSEIRIAQTLVNLVGLEQMMMALGHPSLEQLEEALHKADEALEIYSRHKSHDNPNAELGYYQSLQLKASILDLVKRENPSCIMAYNQAMEYYYLCWQWNKAHPDNQYRGTFIDIAGRILKERNFITKEEFEMVKNKMRLS